MRRSLFLVLALLAASPAAAQVRAIAEIAPPVAPAAAPSASIISAPSMPTLGPALSAPSLAVSPIYAPAFAREAGGVRGGIGKGVAAAPVTAQAALVRAGAALSAASDEGTSGRDEAAASRRAFDGAAGTAAETPAVNGREGASRPVWDGPRVKIVQAPRGRIKTSILETAEVAAIASPFALGALILRGTISDPALLSAHMLGLWALGAWVMRDHLSRLRASIVVGWQASHDQKYRTDRLTGQLRDIRGHEYGSDRYDEYADGPVGMRATALITLAAAAAAAASLLLGR